MSVAVEEEEEPMQGVARSDVLQEGQVLSLKQCHHRHSHVCVQKFRLRIE